MSDAVTATPPAARTRPPFPGFRMHASLLDGIVRAFPSRLLGAGLNPAWHKIRSHPMLLMLPLAGHKAPPLRAGLDISLATAEDVAQLAAHREGFPQEVYLRRLERGDVCYCLRDGGRLVSYNWINFGSCSVYCGFASEVHFRRLAEHQAYTYDFYTYREDRGRGYGLYLKGMLLADLCSRGITELFSCVHNDNDASLKIHLGYGYQCVSNVANFRLLGWTLSLQHAVDDASLQAWTQAMRTYYGLPETPCQTA